MLAFLGVRIKKIKYKKKKKLFFRLPFLHIKQNFFLLIIEAMARILLTFGIVSLFVIIKINASNRPSNHKADQIIRDICERLHENDLYTHENKKWYILCQEWIEKNEQKRYELGQDATITNGKIRN